MKKLKLLILLIIILLPSLIVAGELQTLTLNTGAYKCGYKNVNPHELLWTNEGPPIHIKSSVLWMGAARGSTGDMQATLFKLSTATVINYFGWDRYKNPSSPHQIEKSFGDDWVELLPGDSLSLQYFCNMSPRESYGHVVATVWFVTSP